jgi:uncharacterized protein YkwD
MLCAMKVHPFLTLAAGLLAAIPAPAQSQSAPGLVALINTYRAAPGLCQGRTAAPAAPLSAQAALASIKLAPGAFLDLALERAGYPVAEAKIIYLSGAADAATVMTLIGPRYCAVLTSDQFSAIGTRRDGDDWQIVLARPAPPAAVTLLPPWQDSGLAILAATNVARTTGRQCGTQYYPPAAALTWNAALGAAARAHSMDMAQRHYFRHEDPQGRTVAERARQAGYNWVLVGENIAAGQDSAQAVVADWLTSPGHCANIMNGRFKEMGAAHGSTGQSRDTRIYWTQTFGVTQGTTRARGRD